MFRILLIVSGLMVALPASAFGEAGEHIQAATTYFNKGNPEQAIKTARRALKKAGLTATDRLALLSIVARSEKMRATHQHFQRVASAIQALDAVINEFPDSSEAPEFRWHRAWLWWKSGDNKQAISAAREIISQDQQPANLRRAWLLMARIHIHLKNYAYARSDLLQYGLQVDSKSREQALGMAWMAIVDRGEGRPEMAYRNLHAVYRNWPEVVTNEPELFSTYIHLLYEAGERAKALNLSNQFTRSYIKKPQAPLVRLIRADIHALDKKTIPAAIKEYGILADREAETSIGRKAFMRKLMLEFRHEHDREKLLPVMVSLKKVADSNQLSIVEDEAMLDLARLWSRIDPQRSDANSDKREQKQILRQDSPALHAYARAAASLDKRIASQARAEGAAWLDKTIRLRLDKAEWLGAVSIWRKYPQLRPENRKAPELWLGVAHAMRMLMLFDSSEAMLQTLYRENRQNIRGQRIMMEQARLWMDRQDPDGVKKIMRWLGRHEFSIYRPEMMLIVARMQLSHKEAELARQTINSVAASDIALESRATYWKTRAEISEALAEWHRAARAWKQYSGSRGADKRAGVYHQAANLFAAKDFAEALKLYRQVPEADRDASWQYHMGICEMRTGGTKQGRQRLQKLAKDSEAGRFASLAKLALADQQAGTLLGENP